MCNENCIKNKLFHKAIIHSYSKLYSLKDMELESIEIADLLVGQGNNQLYRLRCLDGNLINEYYNSVKDFSKLFIPNIDNNFIKNNPVYIFKDGLQMKIPIIIGYNFNDGDLLYNIGFNKIVCIQLIV